MRVVTVQELRDLWLGGRGLVLTFAFILLLIAFRSIVIAVKAIVLNLLSVAAAYGTYIVADRLGQSGIIATVVVHGPGAAGIHVQARGERIARTLKAERRTYPWRLQA